MNWILNTTIIPNWVILIYWGTLGVCIIMVYNFGLRYHMNKVRGDIRQKGEVNKSENQQTSHTE